MISYSSEMEIKRLCSCVLIFGIALGPSCGEAHSVGGNTAAIQLGIDKNSAAYIFTQSDASDQLAIKYLEVERKRNQTLMQAWDCAVNGTRNMNPPHGLRKEHLVAVYAYTDSTCSKFYRYFNNVLRMYGTNDSAYEAKFPFKSVHYLLSVALARLKEIEGSAPRTSFRGMSIPVEGQKGQKMIFGYFASSSLSKDIAKSFGNKTLFEIKSHFGVAVHQYSRNHEEQEVLIPPFEEFEITDYSTSNGKVSVSLKGVGSKGIRVNVKRGAGGEMQVVHSSAVTFSAWLCMLALLVHIFA